MIVVQRILTRWTRASRGAPGATRRNAVPEAFPLPRDVVVGAEGACLHHGVVCTEHDGFVPHERAGTAPVVSPMPPWEGMHSCVILDASRGALAVSFRGRDAVDLGSGSARPPDGPCFVLEPGQWGRVLYNGRFGDVDTGEWYYEKKVFNIGSFPSVRADAFLQPPRFACSHLARLR